MELKGRLIRLAGAGAALALGSTVMVFAAPSATAASANVSLPYGASYYTGTATWSNRSVAIDGSFKATGCRRVYARAFAGSTSLDFRSTSTWCDTSGPADFTLVADVVGGSDNIWVYMTDENGKYLKEQTCYRSSGVCIDGLH
ncbi:hypothetical protein [Actinacidiphila paucisporea]|uniref:Secreted protein n=1 Tax=Actinacidiphila paucisporea TaxID=310782 RepID=A0A1M7MIB8_9ACTN|nr:hypothetical protein [Actinacidiphila paucisporea]SHM90699.1 hypothetical protein SAMN05216499_11656 [Actinacidiphila paucisporea]